MGKRQKIKAFSFQGFDNAHYKATTAYANVVSRLFDKATEDVAHMAIGVKVDPNKPFVFDDYPKAKKAMSKIVAKLTEQMKAVVEAGARQQWLFSNKKNDAFISSIFDTTKLTKARLQKIQDRNLDALQTFQQRKVGGMNLSERVWKYTDQYKQQIEVGLDVGLGEGRSAQQLSRDLRQNLQNPDMLFRRVRDKRGNLQLSKSAKAFNPGVGVYRSSYKNAMRLTRSEINMAYREADWLRWQNLDFIVGFEVVRSNHEPLFDCKVCSRLVGRYPKTFKFKGWHPQCMCYAKPIIADADMFNEQELSDLRSALRGTPPKKLTAKNEVTDFPDGFKDWVKENEEKQKNWVSTPYFIKDNFNNGRLSDGLIYTPSVKPLSVLDKARQRHELRTFAQIQEIQKRWDEYNAEKIIKKAYAVKNEVQELALNVAKKFNANVTPISLKTKESIIRKLATDGIDHDVRVIKDAVRTTIVVEANKIEGVQQYFRKLKEKGNVVQRIKVQRGYGLLGYTGTIINIKCSNNLIGEIQVNTYKMIYAKEKPEDAKRIIGVEMWEKIRRETRLDGGLGHKFYEQYRVLTNKEQKSHIGKEIARKSEEYYSHFRE